MSDLVLSEEQFKEALPKGFKRGVPAEVLDDINNMLAKGEEGRIFKEHLIDHTHLLMEGKFSLDQYVSAVKFVSYRIMNHTQRRAYEMTFPEKMADWMSRGVPENTISSYVASYNKSKLVVMVTEATLVPFHVLNQGYRQEALLKEVKLMRGQASGNAKVGAMVQHLAAAKILDILEPPEKTQTELDMKVKESESTVALQSELAKLAAAQRSYLDAGGDLKTVAETPIDVQDADFTEVD